MFAALRELTPPGTVENCVCSSFTKGVKQLVITRQRVLDVFDLDEVNGCLIAEASYTLFGVAESIHVVKRYDPNSLDFLLISFGKGRVSLVSYDETLGPNVLRNVALYNFEAEALGSNLRMESTGQAHINGYGGNAVIVGDPRCASIMLGCNQIGVIPLNKLTEEVDEDEENVVADAEEMKSRLAKAVRRLALPSNDVWEMTAGCFLIDLCKLGVPQGSVLHSAFLKNQSGLPVLAILHNGLVRASAGRLVVTRWTCQLTAITISKHDVTVVWKVNKLPHDSFAVIPNDQGDVVVLSQNSVHLIAGGVIKRSLEVNGFSRVTADINRLTDAKSNIEMSLDSARWGWIDSYRLLLSLRFGQLAMLDVSEFKLTLHGLSNQCSCMTIVGNNYIFLGSRLADSLLLHFKMLCELSDDAVERYDNDEDIFLYGDIKQRKTNQWSKCRSLLLRTTDALPCSGPIAAISVCHHKEDDLELARTKEAAKKLQDRGMHSAAAKLLKGVHGSSHGKRQSKEILASAGRARNGGIRILCPALRVDKDLVCDIELASRCQSLWTLNDDMIVTALWEDPNAFVVHDIKGVEQKKVFKESRILCMANVSGDFLVQVCHDYIKVYSSSNNKLVDSLKEPFRNAYVLESYVLLVTRSRQPKLVHIDKGRIRVMDEFSFHTECTAPVAVGCLCKLESSFICGIIRGGLAERGAGALEVYDVTKNQLLFRSDQVLALGQRVLNHRDPLEPLEPQQEGVLAKLKVVSLCIGPVGRIDPNPHCSAHLVKPQLTVCAALRNGDLLLYRVNPTWEKLFRVENEVITRIDRNTATSVVKVVQSDDREILEGAYEEDEESKKRPRDEENDDEKQLNEEPNDDHSEQQQQQLSINRSPLFKNKPRLFPFSYFSGFCGMMFVNGQGSSTCIIGTRGQVSVVRLDLDAYQVYDIAIYNEKLFILATTSSSSDSAPYPHVMGFSTLKFMKHLRMDFGGSIPFVQVPLKASVTRMFFDPPSRCTVMLCSEDEGTEEQDLAVRANCSIRLLSCDTWEVDHQYSLLRHEKGVCVNAVVIDVAPQNTTPRKFEEYIAVGTGYLSPLGEDTGCTGRILVFSVVAKEGKKYQLVLKHRIESKHIRGPISSITSVDGLVFATFGTTPASLRCFYYDAITKTLVDRSIYDTPFCGVEMASIKNYIVLGDLYRSVRLMHWHSLKKEFRLLARDPHPLSVYSCNFLQSERHLGIIVADNDGNLHVMHFDSQKDTLEQRGEIALSSCATQLLSLPQQNVGTDKGVSIYGCVDGSIGALIPLPEQVFRRLFALQAAMSSSPVVPRNAGLNPRAYRMTEYHNKLQRQRQRTIADGLLLWSYVLLDYVSQRQLARLVGTTPETIFQDLLEIDNALFWKVF